MAKKAKTFAEKAMKLNAPKASCPVCNEAYSILMTVESQKKATNDEWQFLEKVVKVCKCNVKQVYA